MATEMAYYSTPIGLTTGDMATQKEWHMAFRDLSNNMYRTSYQDMIHGKEITVKSDMPSGYGGHIPSLRHDVLFKNTDFDRMRTSLKSSSGRDTLPSFEEQTMGLPSMTPNPRGRPRPPTAGTIPVFSNSPFLKPPWALTGHLTEPLSFRTNMARRDEPSQGTTPRSTARPSTTPRSMAAVGSQALNPGKSRGESRGGPRFAFDEPTEEMKLLQAHIAG